MKKVNSYLLALSLVMGATSAWAQSSYVTDRVRAPVYSDPAGVGPTQGEIKTGDEVEVLERQGTYSKIRIGAVEGWVESKFLRRAKPAIVKLKEANKELNDVKLELRNLADKAMIMEKQMTSISQQRDLAQQGKAATEETESKLREALDHAETRAKMAEAGISIGWIIACIVALVAGALAGIWWEREQNRKKLGGMHIRIKGL